jgi:hypothetical protein
VIALPVLFMAQPDTVARDLAIQHELQHHRGNDLLANMAAQVLLALHWFNPLAWYGWRAMRRDQEAACDARVLAGRNRDERALYAALIVDIAAGPRLALAAPMACPVLGDKSVIHRLRSMSMSDITPGRRWLGRGPGRHRRDARAAADRVDLLLGRQRAGAGRARAAGPDRSAGAAGDRDRSRRARGAQAPAAPEAGAAEQRQVQTFRPAARRARTARPKCATSPSSATARIPAPNVPMPAMPRMEFHAWGDPPIPTSRSGWRSGASRWTSGGEDYGRQWEEWARSSKGRRSPGPSRPAATAPEVVHSCDQSEMARTTTEDGRRRIVICQKSRVRNAERAEARRARAGAVELASQPRRDRRQPGISENKREDILEEIDDEIRRMERADD